MGRKPKIQKLKETITPVKTKEKRTKLELDLLKNFIFEKSALGWTQKQIALETGYSTVYINKLSGDIREEYKLTMHKDKDDQIIEQILMLEGVLKKISRILDKEDKNPYVIQKLTAEFRAILDQLASLRGFKIQKHEISGDAADDLINKFNIISDDK